jgi:hypothetical protein
MPEIPKNEYHLHHAIDVSYLTKEHLIVMCQNYVDLAAAIQLERDDTHRKWLDICQRYERIGQKAGAAGGAAFDTAEERVNWLIEDRNHWRLAAQSPETQKAALDAAAVSLSATGAQLKTVTAERDAARRDCTQKTLDWSALMGRYMEAVAKLVAAGVPTCNAVGEQVDWLIQDRDRWRRDSKIAAPRAPAEPAPSHSLGLNAPTVTVGTTPHPQHGAPDPDHLELSSLTQHWYRCKNEKCRRWVSAQFIWGTGNGPAAYDAEQNSLNIHVKYCPMCGHNPCDKAPS